MHTKALYANAVTMAATGSNSSNIAVSGRSEIPNPTQFQQVHKILENWLTVSWTNDTKTSGYVLFWRWIYFYNRAFYEKKAENLVLLCLFLFSRVNRFFTSQILFLFRCTCGRDCAVNGGRVICSGDGYSSS